MKRTLLTAGRCFLPFVVYCIGEALLYAWQGTVPPALLENSGFPLLLTGLLNLLLIPVFLIMFRNDGIFEHRPADRGIRVPVRQWIAAVTGMTAIGFLMNLILTAAGTAVSDAEFRQSETILTSGGLLLQTVTAVLLAPAAEELLFRGLLYRRLRERLSFLPALLITAAGFGIFHGNLTQGIMAFVMSLLLGSVYERTGALLVPVTMHAAVNGMTLFLAGTAAGQRILGTSWFFFAFAVYSAASIAALIIAFRKE